MGTRQIEVIARGVCIMGGKLLVCHTRGAWNTYLPGGHVEFGESARRSLAREIREELGRSCRVGAFLGAVEHTFMQKGRRHCEVNLAFRVVIPGLRPTAAPASREGHIEFRWVRLSVLRSARLEPAPLAIMIGARSRPRLGPSAWASTFADANA